MFARTPPPPYVAVIFTSLRTAEFGDEYAATAAAMEQLAQSQPGYLGIESARGEDGFGISVSYFAGVEHARAWKQNAEHALAQRLGREKFYAAYRVRIATVDREYGFERGSPRGDE
jgi:heme-degrading monooxygenase HmoA